MRHCGQNPWVRPGRPSIDRPTSAPHDGQNRLDSASSGSTRIAVDGSTGARGGTVVSPAPSRAARSRRDAVPTRRVTPVRPRAEPIAVDASRLDVRVEVDVSSSPAAATGAASGGDPHTSQ